MDNRILDELTELMNMLELTEEVAEEERASKMATVWCKKKTVDKKSAVFIFKN